MVEGWMWLQGLGFGDFYADVGEFLERYHGQQLRAHHLFRG